MPMIDVYAAAGTFPDPHTLARDLAAAVMRWEKVPDLPLFTKNTAAFIHDMDAAAISNGSCLFAVISSPLTDSNRRPLPYHRGSGQGSAGARGSPRPRKLRNPRGSDGGT